MEPWVPDQPSPGPLDQPDTFWCDHEGCLESVSHFPNRAALREHRRVAHGCLPCANTDVTQIIEVVTQYEKQQRIRKVLERIMDGKSKILIFSETKRNCDELVAQLRMDGFPALSIHGGKQHQERDLVLSEFKTGKALLMCATDGVVRGLDITDIMYVINYDMPGGIEDYIHRIEFADRCGESAYSFFTDKDAKMGGQLIQVLTDAGQKVPLELEPFRPRPPPLPGAPERKGGKGKKKQKKQKKKKKKKKKEAKAKTDTDPGPEPASTNPSPQLRPPPPPGPVPSTPSMPAEQGRTRGKPVLAAESDQPAPKNVDSALLSMVESAVHACGCTQPTTVGQRFKQMHARSFEDERKARQLPAKANKLAIYIQQTSFCPKTSQDSAAGLQPTTAQEAAIDHIYKMAKAAGGSLPAHALGGLYVKLPSAKDAIKEAGKLQGLCALSFGRLTFVAGTGPGTGDSIQTDEKQRAQSLASGEVTKTGQPQPQQKHSIHANVPWTDVPDIPAAVSEGLREVVSQDLPENQLQVHLEPWEAIGVSSRLEGIMHASQLSQKVRNFLTQEALAGTADRNKEKLYGDAELQEKLRHRVGASPTQLKEVARELNMTTTNLGFILAGRTIMDRVIDEQIDADHVQRHGKEMWREKADSSDYERRRAIAIETVDCSTHDLVTGYQCKSRSLGHSRESGLHGKKWKEAGKQGESRLERDLRVAGIPFTTEAQDVEEEFATREAGDRATPDVRFPKPQMILGKEVNWMEAKRAVNIPGVSPAQKLERIQKQLEKYVERFGPGAVLWTKCGFCEDVATNEKVAHFRPKDGTAMQSKGMKQPRRTQICVRWRNGRCTAGSRCPFAHGQRQIGTLRTTPQPAAGDDGFETVHPHLSAPRARLPVSDSMLRSMYRLPGCGYLPGAVLPGNLIMSEMNMMQAMYSPALRRTANITGGKTLDAKGMREQRLRRFAQAELVGGAALLTAAGPAAPAAPTAAPPQTAAAAAAPPGTGDGPDLDAMSSQERRGVQQAVQMLQRGLSQAGLGTQSLAAGRRLVSH
jgi:hypothetical protein